MPPTLEDRLRDVLEGISDIDELLAGRDLNAFRADKTLRAATERYLEIVCEAARKIPDHVKQEGAEIDWRKMTNFANLLRHAYHSTKVETVWDIIQNHLPLLKSFVERQIVGSLK
ncbi:MULTISPECIES: HepT-like ribonuclease domain-containing protein [Rhodopseudomonas]|uniref:DUF86 domain-containing protein n=1 Tax=Rhodopseudomonas palustris TaxID=1076 RepID=A0A0D7EI47_RHOPL|nr:MULTISPECIES: HepT-like ribonuclease domain-containing protein [Rhodopseudomonas]KIZ40443.1 hypothetical protein OO17_17685 [Rhodopseudomonas palustris]MDF3808973.1 DUF86 domain-containing protein [Rhodopseudomonas sp. BAL398]WOK20030.1 DUF86 domain-containing protein [Rhodopseudomonas sp. BAL398]